MEEKLSKVQCHIAELKREERLLINKLKKMSEVTDHYDKEKVELMKLLTAHRMSGLTVIKETDDSLLVRLESDYNGKYENAYLIELHKNDDDNWMLVKHDLPPFLWLPSSCFAAVDDPKQIISQCHDFIQSYMWRKGQVEEAKQQFPQVKFKCTSNYSFVSILFETGTLNGIAINLQYSDFDELPIDTQYEIISGAEPTGKRLETLRKQMEFFQKKVLAKAMSKCNV